MKELKGTEKQIAWAEDIRAAYIAEVERLDNLGDKRVIFEESLLCRAFGRDAYDARLRAASADIPRVNPDGTRARCFSAIKAAEADERAKMLEELKTIIVSEESAAWWIDHR